MRALYATSDGTRRRALSRGYPSRGGVPQHREHRPYAGKVFHSAEGDHEVDFAGQHDAVLGTSASVIQIMRAIAARAAPTSSRARRRTSMRTRKANRTLDLGVVQQLVPGHGGAQREHVARVHFRIRDAAFERSLLDCLQTFSSAAPTD
jgi:cation diffusion facilitator CzcD-associated flavoprotein CzcO